MKRFLVLPHADFTLRHPPPSGYEPWDGSHAFTSRLLAAGTMDAFNPADAVQSLRAKAARVIRDRPSPLSALWALQTFLPPWTGTQAFHLRVDDLELAEGTTERLTDVQNALRHPLPFAEELEEALTLIRDSEVARLWLGQDQQLPALLWLANRWPSHTVLEIEGPFAQQHSSALAKHPALRQAQWHSRNAGSWVRSSDGWQWCEAETAPRQGAWTGPCGLRQLLAPGALEDTRCQVAVFRFACLGEVCIDSDGGTCDRSALEARLEVLRQHRVRVIGEWWVGAPAVSLEALETTARVLEQGFPLTALGGIRRFHWTKGRPGNTFAGAPVTFRPPPFDRDLARTSPFDADGTLSEDVLTQQLAALPLRFANTNAWAPGRLAGAYCALESPRPPGENLALDADCAIVDLPVTLDGKPGPAWYALNVRTGDTLRLDARLAPLLNAHLTPKPASQLLPQVGATQRQALLDTFTRKHVLRWT